MSPRNVVRGNAEGGGQALALRRTGSVIAADDGLNHFRIQSRGCDELVSADPGLLHVACYRLHYGPILSLFRTHRRSTDMQVQPKLAPGLLSWRNPNPVCSRLGYIAVQ